MRSDKFKPVEKRFIYYLEQEGEKINTDFNHAKCRVYARYPPDDAPEFGGFDIFIDCLLLKSEFEGADNVALGIHAYDWVGRFTLDADIVWGHPSGKIEAEVFESPEPVTEESLAALENRLPGLVSKLRELIRDNPPNDL